MEKVNTTKRKLGFTEVTLPLNCSEKVRINLCELRLVLLLLALCAAGVSVDVADFPAQPHSTSATRKFAQANGNLIVAVKARLDRASISFHFSVMIVSLCS